MPLGMEVGLSPGDFVLDRVPASPPPIFVQCPLCPKDWVDEDVTWYGSRPRPRPHCIRRGPSSARKGHSSPPIFSAHVYCGHGRPSQLLLSSCTWFQSQTSQTASRPVPPLLQGSRLCPTDRQITLLRL